MITIVKILLASLLFSSSVHSASFDCDKAGNLVEREICADETLSNLDEQLASLYKKINGEKADWRESQLWWLKERNNCQSKQCLLLAYQERVLFFRHVQRNIVKKNTTLSEQGYVFPLVIKNIYEKDESVCGDVISAIKIKVIDNFRAMSIHQKKHMTISYLTSQGFVNLLNIGRKAIPLTKSQVRFETPNGVKNRELEFIYKDINNDKKPEFVVKQQDVNNLSDGYGWSVYPEFNPYSNEVITHSIAKQVQSFNFRENNIDISYGENYVSTDAGGRNFHYEFVTLNDHVYVLLMLHYGYSTVFQENIILADLGEDYQIKNQLCHYELTMKKIMR